MTGAQEVFGHVGQRERATPVKTANTWSAVTLGLSASWRKLGVGGNRRQLVEPGSVLSRSTPALAVTALNKASA
jgi:hypothetical protein